MRLAPLPVKDDEDDAPRFPWVVMLAESKRGLLLGIDLVQREMRWQALANSLLKVFQETQSLPKEIKVEDDEMLAVLKPLMATVQVPVKTARRLRMLDAAFESFGDQLGPIMGLS